MVQSGVAEPKRFVSGSVGLAGLAPKVGFEADYQGGWVKVYELLEDGTVEKTFHKGGSEEAIRIREGAKQGGAA